MAEKQIKVRIKPLHGIGGIGDEGDEVWLPEAEAHYWVKEGYVEIVTETPPPAPPHLSTDGEGSEDHAIMKPQSKRRK